MTDSEIQDLINEFKGNKRTYFIFDQLWSILEEHIQGHKVNKLRKYLYSPLLIQLKKGLHNDLK